MNELVNNVIFGYLVRHRSLFLPKIGSLSVVRVPAVLGENGAVSEAPLYAVNYEPEHSAAESVIDILTREYGYTREEVRNIYARWYASVCRRQDETGAQAAGPEGTGKEIPCDVFVVDRVGRIVRNGGSEGTIKVSDELDRMLNPFRERPMAAEGEERKETCAGAVTDESSSVPLSGGGGTETAASTAFTEGAEESGEEESLFLRREREVSVEREEGRTVFRQRETVYHREGEELPFPAAFSSGGDEPSQPPVPPPVEEIEAVEEEEAAVVPPPPSLPEAYPEEVSGLREETPVERNKALDTWKTLAIVFITAFIALLLAVAYYALRSPGRGAAEPRVRIVHDTVYAAPSPAKDTLLSAGGLEGYHVVGGAYMNELNADKVVEGYRAAGYKPVKFYSPSKELYIVSLGAYPTEAEARSALNRLPRLPYCESYWIYRYR